MPRQGAWSSRPQAFCEVPNPGAVGRGRPDACSNDLRVGDRSCLWRSRPGCDASKGADLRLPSARWVGGGRDSLCSSMLLF